MSVDIEEIKKLLTTGKDKMQRACKMFLEACREPVAWDKLKKIKDLKVDYHEVLIVLKKAKALDFKDGKYFASKEDLEVLKEVLKDEMS